MFERTEGSKNLRRMLAILLVMILVISTTSTVMADDAAEETSGVTAQAETEKQEESEASEALAKETQTETSLPAENNNGTESTVTTLNGDVETSAGDTNNEYVVNYLNTDGVVEFTKKYEAGESVDLSQRLGGGEAQTGWALTKDGEAIGELNMPASDVTLYPVINQNATTYKVNFLKEKVDGTGYELADSIVVDAEAGDSVSADAIQSSEYAMNYDYFTYDGSSSSSAQQVASDGSTVVEVKFNRNTYTLSFDIDGNYRDVGELYYSTLKMNIGGTEYTGTQYSFTAKYGEDISGKLPTKDNVVDNMWLVTQHSDYFTGWTDSSGNLYVGASTLDGSLLSTADGSGNINLIARWEGSNNSSGAPTVTIKYNIYHQNVDNDEYEYVETVSKSAVASALSTVTVDGYEGFTYAGYTNVGELQTVTYGPWYAEISVNYYAENNVYFDRNSYDVIFKVNTETVGTATLKYGESMSSLNGYEPINKPAGRSYIDGWYDADGVTYTFDGKMPAKNVVLTGSWKYGILETKSISYDANGGEGDIDTVTVAIGATVRLNDGSTLTREGYEFKGWNTQADGEGITYEASELYDIYEDIALYAVWEEIQLPDDPDPVDPDDSDVDDDEVIDADDEDSDKSKDEKDKKDKTAETGDDSNVALWGLLSLISLMGIAVAARRRSN